MTATVFIAMVVIHLAFSVAQVMKNSFAPDPGCVDIANLVCGSPLESLLDVVQVTSRPGGFGGIVLFFIGAVKSFLSFLFQFAFIDYEWTNGGGQITDLVMMVFRLAFGAIFITTIGRMALSIIGGKL